MNILLVDDDYFVVAALEKKIDWKALSIEQVYTAYSVAQARDILRRFGPDPHLRYRNAARRGSSFSPGFARNNTAFRRYF